MNLNMELIVSAMAGGVLTLLLQRILSAPIQKLKRKIQDLRDSRITKKAINKLKSAGYKKANIMEFEVGKVFSVIKFNPKDRFDRNERPQIKDLGEYIVVDKQENRYNSGEEEVIGDGLLPIWVSLKKYVCNNTVGFKVLDNGIFQDVAEIKICRTELLNFRHEGDLTNYYIKE